MASNDVPKDVLEFFLQLPHRQPALHNWLLERSRSYDERMRKERDDVTLRQVQGRAQELDELLGLIQRSPAILEKMRKAP